MAFADVLALNKTDLVDSETLDNIEAQLREMKRMARFLRSEHRNTPIDKALNLDTFDLNQIFNSYIALKYL